MVEAILCLIVGLVVGFFGARYYFKKQLQKNPPINEKYDSCNVYGNGKKTIRSTNQANYEIYECTI